MKVAGTLKKSLWGIINAAILKADNSFAESINSRINTVKVCVRGFRKKRRFRDAIYLHIRAAKKALMRGVGICARVSSSSCLR